MASHNPDSKMKARNVIQSYGVKHGPPVPPRVNPGDRSTVSPPHPDPGISRSAMDLRGSNGMSQGAGVSGERRGGGAVMKEIRPIASAGNLGAAGSAKDSVDGTRGIHISSSLSSIQTAASSQGPGSPRGRPVSGAVPPVYCNTCSALGSQEVATSFCFTCLSARCIRCTDKHDRSPTLSRHVSVNMSDSKLDAMVCREHSSQCVVCFCLTCSKPVCSLCIQWGHETHSRAEFKAASRESKAKFQAVEGALNDARELIKSQQESYESDARIKEEKRQEFRKKVLEHLQGKIEQLRLQQSELLNQYDANYERERRDINVRCGKLDKYMQSLTGIHEELNYTNLPLPWQDTIILDKEIPVQTVANIAQEVRRTDPDASSRSTDFKFVPGPNAQLGTMEKVYSNIVSTADQILTTAQSVLPASESFAVWKCLDQACVTDIVILNHNCDVLCVSGLWPNKALSLFDLQTGSPKQTPVFLSRNSRGIMKVAARFEHLAVLRKANENDRCELTLYNNHNYLCTFRCKENCQPRAIVVTDTGSVVMATINDNTLLCYSVIGELLWTHAPSPRATVGGFQLPRAVTVDKSDQVFMADIQGHKVHVYRHEDQYTRSFPPQVSEAVNPVGVCLGRQGELYVAFGKPMCVVSQFAASGLLLKHVVKLPYEPTAVQYVEEYNLVLIGTYGNGLWVCRGDEEFVFMI